MVTNYDTELAEPNKWPVDDEVHLLYSTLDNKPVGECDVFSIHYGMLSS